MSFDVNHFQNQTLSDVSRIEERLIAVACFFFVKHHSLKRYFFKLNSF